MTDIETNGYRFIVTPNGTVEAMGLKNNRGEDVAEYVTDNREVGNLLLLAVAGRLEVLCTFIRVKQESER